MKFKRSKTFISVVIAVMLILAVQAISVFLDEDEILYVLALKIAGWFWIIGIFLAEFVRTARQKKYFIAVISFLVAFGLMGSVFNISVKLANGGKVPIITSDGSYLARSVNGSKDYILATNNSKLLFLADYQISPHIAISLGDIIIGISGWLALLFIILEAISRRIAPFYFLSFKRAERIL